MGITGRGSGVFVSAVLVGTNADGEPVTTSVEDQVVALFDNLARTLAAAGLEIEHVVRVTSFIRSYDPEFMTSFRAVRARYLPQDPPPASVMIQAGRYDPCLLVQSEVIAIVP
jgi:enamine deaminase RidA (YjgF/YER057c/UK114 family)